MKLRKVVALSLAAVMSLSAFSSVWAEEAAAEGDDIPLVVGIDYFQEKYSPFFAENVSDQTIVDLTQVGMIGNDRSGGLIYNGIEGEDREYNGTMYHYNGIADVTVTEGDTETVYNFKLRDDIVYEDGEPLTADDVIFSFYVLADTDYDGNATFYSTNVKGLKNYRLNSTAAEDISEEDISAVLEEMPEALADQIKNDVVEPLLASEYSWCEGAWEDYAEDFGVSSADEFFVTLYSTDADYDGTGKSAEELIADLTDMYGADYAGLAAAYGDAAYLDADAENAAQAFLVEQKTAEGEGEEVPNIEGIRKLGDYEVEFTTNGFDATTIYQLSQPIGAMHYYGDPALYDYDNNMFGFTRGDLSSVRSKSAKPLAAGPYKFVKYENKTVYLEANDNYYDGVPKIRHLQFRETSEPDKISGITTGTIDLADPSGSKENFEQIRSFNSNGELTGDVLGTSLVDNLGYGYIGINANTVNVGGEPDSDASRNLRKALATILAVYRDVAVDSYYGDAASVINYPISNTSWAAPQKSDSDYAVAYSRDVDGNPIYTDDMTDEEKFAAASDAALGFFEAAGYTVENGVLTAAPDGAKLSYEIFIGGAGTGDHPSFAILTDAKAALSELGLSLEINDITDTNIMWDALNAGTAELWTAAWQQTIDPDMYQIYHTEAVSSNYYHISDPTLDADIIDARSTSDQEYRKSVYKECLEIILDWGVEVPVYQRQNCILYSTERIKADTFTPDVTTYYNWYAEINGMEMN